jgi:cell division septation protein DedD
MPERKRTTSTKAEPAKAEVTKAKVTKAKVTKAKVTKAEPAAPQAYVRGGWLLQIGAFEGEDETRQHLSTAQLEAPTAPAASAPRGRRAAS